MTTPITSDMIVIPNYLYNDASAYLPKLIVDDLMEIVRLSDHTEVPVHDTNKTRKWTYDESMQLIKNHHRSKLPKSASAVPSAMLMVVGMITLLAGYDVASEIIVLAILLTVVSTYYLFEIRQSELHRLTIADNTVMAINRHISIEIKQKIIENLTTTIECQVREIELYRIDQTEMNIRYQSVFDYFSQCSPKETKAYVAGLEDSHVTVHTHRGMQ